MAEPPASATREAAPPAPPRWKGSQSLGLVHQLNERCIELLREVAGAEAVDPILSIVQENRELWVRLTPDARVALARMPFVVVDAHFKDASWWRQVSDAGAPSGLGEPSNGLPRQASEHLMHETTMFAWQTARWDRTVAQLSLGMAPAVIDAIAALTPQQIRIIATHEARPIAETTATMRQPSRYQR